MINRWNAAAAVNSPMLRRCRSWHGTLTITLQRPHANQFMIAELCLQFRTPSFAANLAQISSPHQLHAAVLGSCKSPVYTVDEQGFYPRLPNDSDFV